MSYSDTAISVRGLSKVYTISHDGLKKPNFRELIVDRMKNPLRKMRTEQFWALKDVSFEVKKGDVVGIIGRNGAGKSTLLKILSRIVEPTGGEVDLFGRVGSLLEVGTGFHPELTGRENIFLNGAILGMKREEIKKQFDAIVEFAEVEKFLDTPVKRYSSGMYVRLAFAVAAHLNPEILIVDEVLAVGDSQFQKKCLGKMGEVAKGGRTVLFVSHNMAAVRGLCARGIMLSSGKTAFSGTASDAIERYLRSLDVSDDAVSEHIWTDQTGYPGNEHIRVRAIRVVADQSEIETTLQVGKPIKIECEYWNLVPGRAVILNPVLYSLDGTPICESFSMKTKADCDTTVVGLYRSTCSLPADFLNEGHYRLRLDFHDQSPAKLFSLPEAIFFSVIDSASRDLEWYGRLLGFIRMPFPWNTELLMPGNAQPYTRSGRPEVVL